MGFLFKVKKETEMTEFPFSVATKSGSSLIAKDFFWEVALFPHQMTQNSFSAAS